MKTKETAFLGRFRFEVLFLLLFAIGSCSEGNLVSEPLEDIGNTYELIDPQSADAIVGVPLSLEGDESFAPGVLVYESVYESGVVIQVIKEMNEYAFIGKIMNHPSDGVICNTVMGLKEYYAPCEGQCIVVCEKSFKP